MSKFKVGDRVLVMSGCDTKSRFGWEASVIDGPDRAGCFDYEVRYDDGQQELFYENNLMAAPHPTPTPAEKLRAAAEIVARHGGHVDGGGAFDYLNTLADHLEAAAAAKPTLREAAEKISTACTAVMMSRGLSDEERSDLRDAWLQINEALAREEASKS